MLVLEPHRPAHRLDVSVVVPVYNEHENLPELLDRLTKVLGGLDRSYELVFVDDGSSDGSVEWLRERAGQDEHVGVVEFQANFGQHAAVFAGLEAASGDAVVTLDADLQNPPEEIPNLLAALEEGHDVAAGWRSNRQDPLLRRVASYLVNRLMSRATGVHLHDYGCMLRAYRREVVDCLCQCAERSSFIPALANVFARSVVEVPVDHAARTRGDSKYSLMKLLSLNYDLLTGFSVLPIHWVSSVGLLMALGGLGFGALLLIRRLFVGPEAEGVFTLMAILFVFTGLQLLAVGMVGQYIARTYSEARGRPRYVVRKLHGRLSSRPASTEADRGRSGTCPE
jgi:undecaprenyl-phosphate 4-deoxy-4-formamido-L-arabinose transferase